MKQIILLLSILFITSKSFTQDSLIKPSKFYLEAQGGYAEYSSQYQGTFLGVGLKYKYAGFLSAYSSFIIMNGVNKEFFSGGNVQIKSIYAGTNAEYAFYKRHSIGIGAGFNFTITSGAYRSNQISSITPTFYFQAYMLRKYGMGFHYTTSYMFKFTSRFKAGLFFNQEFTRGFSDGLSSRYNLLTKYGTSVKLNF